MATREEMEERLTQKAAKSVKQLEDEAKLENPNPEDSVWYHPVYNPFGAAPQGETQQFRKGTKSYQLQLASESHTDIQEKKKKGQSNKQFLLTYGHVPLPEDEQGSSDEDHEGVNIKLEGKEPLGSDNEKPPQNKSEADLLEEEDDELPLPVPVDELEEEEGEKPEPPKERPPPPQGFPLPWVKVRKLESKSEESKQHNSTDNPNSKSNGLLALPDDSVDLSTIPLPSGDPPSAPTTAKPSILVKPPPGLFTKI